MSTVGSVALVATLLSSNSFAQELPNIIIIYADDLGYGDLSAYNPDAAYKTPRLDRMAAEGIRFVDAHSPSTICSPSRYGLYSGQQVFRTGRGSRAFEGPGGPSYIKPGEMTIADMVKKRGYRTGVFGKWHVGLTWYDKSGKKLGGGFENSLLIDYERSTPMEDGPNRRGFDESFITPNCPTTDPLYIYIENGMVPTPASERHKRDTLPNPGGKWRWDNDEGWMAPGYRFVAADLLFYDKTIEFITKHRKNHADKPFFVVFSTQISHAPVLPAPEFEGKSGGGPRGDFIHELDVLTGRLLDAIDSLGIDDNTLVIFNSDNGPETVHTDWMRRDHDHDAAGGFRGMKRDGWEGGHRVPFIARWPGHVPAGTTSDELICLTDMVATAAALVGRELGEDEGADSCDILPALLDEPHDKPVRENLVMSGVMGVGIRENEWLLIPLHGSGGLSTMEDFPIWPHLRDLGWQNSDYAANGDLRRDAPQGQLYNIVEDPSQSTNVYNDHPAIVKHLTALLHKIGDGVNLAQRAGNAAEVFRDLVKKWQPE